MLTTTTQIPSAVSEYYNRLLLERALPDLVYELFGQVRPLPQGNSMIAKFRRYETLGTAISPLTQGVPPGSSNPTKSDITATVLQYGAWIEYTDIVDLSNPDPTLTEFQELQGEQSAQSIDIIRRDVLKAGTGVTYANGSARADVNSIISLATLRSVRRTLRNNNASWIRDILSPSQNVDTQPIPMSYACVISPDVSYDVRNLTGFVGVEEYGTRQVIHESEIGAIPSIQMRFLETTQAPKVAGGGAGGSGIKTTSSAADVYLCMVFARNAYGVIPLRGAAMSSILKARGSGGTSDPLDQIGTIGWKAITTTAILNDNFMHRIEVAASS